MLQKFTDDEIMEHCGLDSLCFLRTLQMGAKLCLVGVFNALWLIPLYATANESAETANIDDAIVASTVANLPSGDPRLVATALASYLLFGYTMYLIYFDFKWFIGKQHGTQHCQPDISYWCMGDDCSLSLFALNRNETQILETEKAKKLCVRVFKDNVCERIQ